MLNPVYDPAEPNSGHGHAFPRPDGAVARCGGPGLCNQCAADLARKVQLETTGQPLAQDWEPIQPGSPIEFPCIAVPEDFSGTAAEAVGLAVAGAVGALEEGRQAVQDALDDMREELVECLTALEALVEAFPESSWAHTTAAKEEAQALLDRLAPKPKT